MAAETAPMTTIGDCLRATREHQGLTLERAAELSGISISHLSRLESSERQPSVASLLALSAAFGVPVGTLFGETQGATPLDARATVRMGGDIVHELDAVLEALALSGAELTH